MNGDDQTPVPQGNWRFNGDDGESQLQSVKSRQVDGDFQTVSWTASEFIVHEKTAKWYFALSGATIVGAAIVFLLTRDYITTGIIIFAALMFGVMAARKPRQLEYQVDNKGITVAGHLFAYGTLRSFSIAKEGPFVSIAFTPLRRFSPLLTAYVDPKDEDTIIDILSDYLPHEERPRDPIDQFLRRIRF